MSITEKSIDENLVSEAPVSALDSLFEERDTLIEEKEEEKPKEKEVVEQKKQKAKPEEESEPKEGKKEKSEEPKSKATVKGSVDYEEEQEQELTKLKKALNDSQKWGHTNNKRLKSAAKIIASLKDEGALTEEEFGKLNDLFHSDPEEEPSMEPVSDNPLLNLIQKAGKRVSDLEDFYEDDPLYRKKLQAFDFFVNHASDKEADEIYEELKPFEGNELKLAKMAYKIGERFYDEGYGELDKSGGLKEFISSKNSEIKSLKRKLDKLEAKLLDYDDYDTPTNKIDELRDTNNVSTETTGSVLDQAIEERDRKRG